MCICIYKGLGIGCGIEILLQWGQRPYNVDTLQKKKSVLIIRDPHYGSTTFIGIGRKVSTGMSSTQCYLCWCNILLLVSTSNSPVRNINYITNYPDAF